MGFQKLLVSPDGRRLIHADGSPFFYLGDTAWELFHKLTREEAIQYLDHRAAHGFTAIQAVALSEFHGLSRPNAYGRFPLLLNADGKHDPALPDLGGEYSYWDHVDYIVRAAAERGLYIALLPTWGDKYNKMWGAGPEIFTPENARGYGQWLGARYRDQPNIIWVLGGDRPLHTRAHFGVIAGMAEGLRGADGGSHLITFHPMGQQSSATYLHGEAFLDFNMVQTGHSRNHYNYKAVRADYDRQPPKPILDGEPGYEGHPDGFEPANGYLDAADVRASAYWAVLSGACGHTYGHHSIWSFVDGEMPDFQPNHFCMSWRQALTSEGAEQMGYVKKLAHSRDFLTAAPEDGLIEGQGEGVLHIPVLKGDGFLLAYTAQGTPIHMKMGALNGERLRASWFNPRDGVARELGWIPNEGVARFVPPSGGRGQDWVLMLDEEARDAASRF